MPDKPPAHRLAPTEVDLALLAAQRGRQDQFLLDLIELADARMHFAVGLLLNGMVVVGAIVPAEEIAKEIDGERARIAGSISDDARPDDVSPDQWKNQLEFFSTATSEGVSNTKREGDELDQELAEAAEDGMVGFDELPAEIARKAIYHQARPYLTLKQVQIASAGQAGTMRLDVLRVSVPHISAWWPVRLDEDGSARFNLFTTSSD